MPNTPVVTLEEAKQYLNVQTDIWDDTIQIMLDSAASKLQHYTGCSFSTKDLQYELERKLSPVELPNGPIQEVTGVVAIDEEGNETDLELNKDYFISGIDFKKIKFATNGGLAIVSYTAGYENLPGDLKLAILKQVGMDFEYRESVVATATISELSNTAKELAKSYRRIVLF